MTRHSSLADQLAANRKNLKNNLGDSSSLKYFNALPRVPTPHTDGIDHINISNRARTEIGEVLWIESLLPFNHDIIGRCASVAAGWDFLTTGCIDPSLRTTPRSGRRRIVEELRSNENTRFTMNHGNFIFIDLLWAQIMQINRLKEELLKTSLPFDCYQLEGELNLPFRSRIARRVVESMEFVRDSILNNEPPDAEMITNGKTRAQVYSQFKRQEVVYTKDSIERKNSLMQEISMSVTSRARKRVVSEITSTEVPKKEAAPIPVEISQPPIDENEVAGILQEELLFNAPESSVREMVEETPAAEKEVDQKIDADPRAVGFVVSTIGTTVEISEQEQIDICSYLLTEGTMHGFESSHSWQVVYSCEVVDFSQNAVTHALVAEIRTNQENEEEAGLTVIKYDASEPFVAENVDAFSDDSLILVFK